MSMNLETPCILIDIDKLDRNIIKMARLAKDFNVSLRPHIKTHKIPQIAKMQIDAGAKGITVAKLSEAEIMAEAGIKDIFMAYPVIGESKIARLLKLNEKVRIIVGIDSIAGARALSDAATGVGKAIEVRLEIDTGLKRTGIPYDQVQKTAKEISGFKGLKITGIYTFKGLMFQGKGTEDRERAGLEEGQMMVEVADSLRKAGMEIDDVSVGSTPTAEFVARVPGITEIRPGTYVFNDVMQVKVGSCSWEDCAASILTTVVSRPSDKLIIIDGGSKTLSADVIPGAFPYYLEGYGKVIGYDNLIPERLTEEHGMLAVKGAVPGLKTGDTLRIIPNHVCTAINLQNYVYFTKNDILIDKVKVEARGMVY